MTKIKVLKNKKGFTLIELIVVMAILAILAAIAIPKFSAMRVQAAVNADASTAQELANSCRIQETQTGKIVTSLTPAATDGNGLQTNYMAVPIPQTGGTFTLSLSTTAGSYTTAVTGGGGVNLYIVSFTPSASYIPYQIIQDVIEHTPFSINKTS